MSTHQTLADLRAAFLKKTLEPNELVERLKSFHHAPSALERSEVIDTLALVGSPDATRDLIDIFRDCEWRQTRFLVLRALARSPQSRGLEFLFKISQDLSDLPMAETAIAALGQSHQSLAARFLRNSYLNANATLKPACAAALGHVPDRIFGAKLYEDLQWALKQKLTALSKNIVLTLGEIKWMPALECIAELARDRSNEAVSLCALISLGKLTRDPSLVQGLEAAYSKDALEYQLYLNTCSQVQFRSQWTLEDYLQKIFSKTNSNPHRSLPLELNGFPVADVCEALTLFKASEHTHAMLASALWGFDAPNTSSCYETLIPWNELTAGQWKLALSSIAQHQSAFFEPLLFKLLPFAEKVDPSLVSDWIETLALCVPQPTQALKRASETPALKASQGKERVRWIGSIFNVALADRSLPSEFQQWNQLLMHLWTHESEPEAQARLLRMAAQLGWKDDKLGAFVKENISDPTFAASVLLYLEAHPSKKALPILETLLKSGSAPATTAHTQVLLRALAAQEEFNKASTEVTQFVIRCTQSEQSTAVRMEALKLIRKNPLAAFLQSAQSCLKEESLQTQALIALKAYGLESLADEIAKFLNSKNPSTAGRALDTLASLPGLRAKRLCFDHLKDNSDSFDVVEKVLRSVPPPESGHDYFVDILNDILKTFPDHPLTDSICDYREKLIEHKGKSQKPSAPSNVNGPDIGAVDKALSLKISTYPQFDESVKSTLRSAELPFFSPQLFQGSVDKASSVLEFCKAVDLFLERHLGRSLLFPKLETSLHEFQNVIHLTTLNEESPSPERVLRSLGLEKNFSSQSLPTHKMQTVGKAILSGRILQDRFKTLDGLRAWAVMLLLFSRKLPQHTQQNKILIPLKGLAEDQVVKTARRLMALQDIRNPAAHRQTFLEFLGVGEVRSEVFDLFKDLEALANV